jgi:hypothetical protein
MHQTSRIMISAFSLAAAMVGLVGSAAAADNPAVHALPPTPAQLWQQIRALEKSKSIMPFSHAFQPGSRTVDVFTTDLSNQSASTTITTARSVQAVTRYPNGSLLVKKNYNAQHQLTGVTAMLKLSGYDAANRNWVMAAYSPAGKSVAFGKITSCDACHAMVTKSDFVFAPPPSQLLPVSVWKAFFPKQAMSPTYVALLARYPGSIIK